jgi:hypothetical protein
MTEIVRNYHKNLQDKDINDENLNRRCENITQVINQDLPAILNASKAELAKKINKAETTEALKSAANRKVAGLDGIPYELYKKLKTQNINLQRENCRGFDITKALTLIFNDIKLHEINNRSLFNQGWMCPIYKKK